MKLSIVKFLVYTLIQLDESESFIVSPAFKYGLNLAETKNIKAKSCTLPKKLIIQKRFMSAESEEKVVSIAEISKELKQYEYNFFESLKESNSTSDIESLRVSYLGKKGYITTCMSYMKSLSNEEKPKLGAVINEIKTSLESEIASRKTELQQIEVQKRMEEEWIDVTLPGLSMKGSIGHRHPLSMTMEKATEIFVNLGYDTVTDASDSPEIETDYYCFQALNCPEDHPARDMQDTFYLTQDRQWMLRTHTSSVQIRQMEKRKPPFRIVAPGRVYRRDDIDATHSMIFHQVEILAIEEYGKLTLGHLKGTVEYFLKQMFGNDIKVRFRGSYFPFTEPSMEVDVFFRGKWLEVLGCGMVDPNVLEMAGIDSSKYSGFAAGFGVERFAMVIHEIPDIREFYKNDIRFLEQFPHFSDDGMYAFLDKDKQLQDRLNHIDYFEKENSQDFQIEPTPLEFTKLSDVYIKLPPPPGYKPPPELYGSTTTAEDDAKTEEEEQATQSKKKKSKKEKQSSPSEAASANASNEVDISKLDIRVGIIKNAYPHESAEKLYCEEIDIGEETGPRNIASGIRPYYETPDLLIGKKVLVLANLKSRKLQGFPSHGMILCASKDDQVVIVEPPENAQVGERITVDGYDGEPATGNQIDKKKMLDTIFPLLKTNEEGVATYNNVPLSTSAGACVAQGNLPDAPVS